MPYADPAKQKEAQRRHYLKHRELVKARTRARYAANGEECRAQIAAWKRANPEKRAAQREREREKLFGPRKNDAHVRALRPYLAAWNAALREQSRRSRPWYGLSDAEEYRVRYHNDPAFRIHECLRRQIRKKSEGCGFPELIRAAVREGKRSNRVESVLDCTVEQFREHLRKQFRHGMTWENYGKDGWHIDHILPKRCFDIETEEGFEAYWALSNLRPLSARENLRKHDRVETLL